MTSPRETLAARLTAAGVAADRFIPVKDGTKRSTVKHNKPKNRLDTPPEDGNYGVYAGPAPDHTRWLVDVDIDDYSDDVDAGGLREILQLTHGTLGVESPHTDGERGGHRYIVVDDPTLPEQIEEATGAVNPTMSWGEVRVQNQYTVGPGSVLDGCEKEWCDECATPEGGRYEIATDAPAKTVETDALLDALADDEDWAGGADDGGVTDDPPDYEPTNGDDRAARVAKKHDWVQNYLLSGADDRSSKDFAVCCLMIEYGVAEDDARDLLDGSTRTKVSDRGDDYWSETWTNARREVGGDAGSKMLPGDVAGPQSPSAEGDVDAESDGGGTATAAASATDPTDGWREIRTLYNQVEDGNANRGAARYQTRKRVLQNHHFRNLVENDALYYYRPDLGIYEPNGDRRLRELLSDGLREHFSRAEVNELAEAVRAQTTIDQEQIGGPKEHVAVKNGVLRLDGDEPELLDHSPTHEFLSVLGTHHDPDAGCPRWRRFLKEVVPEAAHRDTLQEFVGYTLMHWALPWHKALFMVGPRASGKSTFNDTVRALLGDGTVASLTPQEMVERFGGAELHGAWANIRNDIPSATVKNVGTFKEIIAGDNMKAERKGKDLFFFGSHAKHIFAANTLPDAEVDDDSFYRRILLVPFPSTVPREKRDRQLGDKLQDELPGILNWALEGLDRLREQGGFTFDRPQAETAETWDKWGHTADRFASTCLETSNTATPKPKAEVYRRYQAFCQAESMPTEPQQNFTRRLKTDHGVTDGTATVDGKQLKCFLNVEYTHRAEQYAPGYGRDTDDDDGHYAPGRNLDNF